MDEAALLRALTTRTIAAGSELCDCDNAATVSENGDVTLSWRAHT